MKEKAKGRTLSNLLRLRNTVWVRIETPELWERFTQAAEEEGFRLGKGRPTEAERDSVMVIEKDRRIGYPGVYGHMAFDSSGEPMMRVDYGAYIEGRDDFLLNLEVIRRLVPSKRPAYVKSEVIWG